MEHPKTAYRSVHRQNGLSLLELLATIAIISVLGMVSTPLYQGYKLKTKVGTAVVTMQPIQRLATEHFMVNGSWPVNNAQAGARPPETYSANYITSITLSDSPSPGSIVLTYDNSALRMLGNKNTLVYYPEVTNNSGAVTWKCDKGTLDSRYRPNNCRA